MKKEKTVTFWLKTRGSHTPNYGFICWINSSLSKPKSFIQTLDNHLVTLILELRILFFFWVYNTKYTLEKQVLFPSIPLI